MLDVKDSSEMGDALRLAVPKWHPLVILLCMIMWGWIAHLSKLHHR